MNNQEMMDYTLPAYAVGEVIAPTIAPSTVAFNPVPAVSYGTTNGIPTVGGWLQNNTNSLSNLATNIGNKIKGFGADMSQAWQGLNGMDKFRTVGSALAGAYDMYNAHQNLKLAKEQLRFGKEQYYTNLNNQRKMINSRLADRQAVREQTAQYNKGGVESVKAYMDKYGV